MSFRLSFDPTGRRLSGLDALFLSLETPEQPMQIVVLGLLRAGTDGPLALEDLRRRLTTRLDQLPAFRWRVIPVLFGLACPAFVQEPHVDLGDHIRYAVLPRPGGPAELDAACAQLASQCLESGRPLWRITLIDGLADGRQAIVLEVHHALMDGFALRTTLARIFSEEQPIASPSSKRLGRMPRRARLVAAGLAHGAQVLARLPELVVRAKRASAAVRRQQAGSAVKVPQAGVDTPLSVVNQGFTPERRFARAVLPLEVVLAVKDLAGVTVNDVVLALVGGALRGYLHERGELPDRPLVASVPVSMEGPVAALRTEGNRFTRVITSLATDVADPWERLQRVSAVTAEAKTCLDLAGRGLQLDVLECVPPMLMNSTVRRAQAARRRPGKRAAKLDVNVMVSNLRGPSIPWRFGSTTVEETYLAGPPNSGVGVTFAVWDYAGRLLVGILAFADSFDNPAELSMRLSRSLEELVTVAERSRISAT